ncbi:protein phosphatase, partial [Arthrobacter sp. Y81]
MQSVWDADESGVMQLPSGRLLRGRGFHKPIPRGATPDFALYLLGKKPAPVKWEARWVLWPDFRLPKDRDDARDALREAWLRSETERVEIACTGGHGRTGTALACIAVFDGVPAD